MLSLPPARLYALSWMLICLANHYSPHVRRAVARMTHALTRTLLHHLHYSACTLNSIPSQEDPTGGTRAQSFCLNMFARVALAHIGDRDANSASEYACVLGLTGWV